MPIEFNREEIEEIFMKAEIVLFDKQNISPINYNNFDYRTFDANNKDLLKSISGYPIVYCIWAGKSYDTLAPRYIGSAAPKYSRGRIRAHLAYCSEKTSAKLDRVKKELEAKNTIGLSIVTILPLYMRKALEEWLIEKYLKLLTWNNGKF